jgi:hypothetical protein
MCDCNNYYQEHGKEQIIKERAWNRVLAKVDLEDIRIFLKKKLPDQQHKNCKRRT